MKIKCYSNTILETLDNDNMDICSNVPASKLPTETCFTVFSLMVKHGDDPLMEIHHPRVKNPSRWGSSI